MPMIPTVILFGMTNHTTTVNVKIPVRIFLERIPSLRNRKPGWA